MVGKGFIATGNKAVFRNFKRQWFHVDAKEQVVGRLATQICKLLLGKHKPIYDPSEDCGDYVVVTNAKDVVFTRNQWRRKLYRWHTGYPGGLREMPALVMRERFPERILEKAVWGMLPKNKLRYSRFQKLRVFAQEHNLAPDIVKKIAPLPPHFTQREYVAEKLDADDPMAHLRGFYVVRTVQSDQAFEATGVYVPTKEEEAKRAKQIARYIKRRPALVHDIPQFGKYVVEDHNAPPKPFYGMDGVNIVKKEAAEDRARGVEPIPTKKVEPDYGGYYDEELLEEDFGKKDK